MAKVLIMTLNFLLDLVLHCGLILYLVQVYDSEIECGS